APPVAVDDAASTNEDQQVDIDVLANDSDVDGDLDPASVTVTSGPTNGTTSINPATGVITYTKSGDFNGADSFVYQVCDDGTPLPALCATATVSITIDPVNDPPVADADAATTDEDTAVTITLTGSDIDGDPLTFAVASPPGNGSLGAITQLTPTSASVTYTPNADFNGSDSFTFTSNDGTVNSAPATISLTVNPINDPPTADPGAATTDEDVPVTITLTGGDVDADPLTFAIASGPANGSLSAITPISDTTAEVTYTPAADFNGTDSFTFFANDGTVDSASATISLTVNPVNDPPVADAGTASTDEDTAVTITLNGSDVEGNALTFAIVTGPGNGALGAITPINDTTAELTYTPAPDFNGADSFTFSVNDGALDSAAATVEITINPVNDPPTADAASATTDEDTPVTITLTGGDVDGDPLAFAVATPPASGSLGTITQLTPTSASVTYSPNTDFNGTDSFTITTNDGTVASAPATVALTVNPVNDPPVANDGAATTEEDIAVTITLTGSDIDGDPLTFAIAGGPSNGALGTITQVNDTSAEVTYTPTTGFSGSDSFSYTASDATVTSAPATISITVTPGNAPPVANSAMPSTDEDAPVVITLTGSDADSDPLTFAIATGPGNGALSAIAPVDATSAQVTYTPSANFSGSDSFTFTVNDGTETSPSATVSLTVNAVNDPPTVVDHTLTTHSAIRITLGAADNELLKDGAADIDDPPAALSVSPLPATSTNGALLTLVDPATGTYQYDPPGGFTGADSFTYEVCDSATTAAPVQCATGTVNVNVTGPALWVVNPSATAGGDGSLNRPFQALSSLPGARATGARIFLASGNNAGGHAFVANERLIGQGATGNTFDGFHAVQVPANGTLDARPAMAGTRPVVQGQVSLANTVQARGFNIAPASGTQGLFGNGAFTGIDVSQMNVAASNAPAVNLNGVTGNFTLDRVDANGGANGIVLVNTNSASGSFTVAGTGGACTAATPTCTGGRIQATAGANGEVAGNGVYLENTRSVAFTRMRIGGHQNHAIFGTTVTGFSLVDSVVDGVNGNDAGADEGSVRFVNLLGSGAITRSDLSGGLEDNLRLVNNTGTLNRLVITDTIFRDNSSALGNDGILIQSIGTAVVNVTVDNSDFSGHRGDHFDAAASDSAALDLVFTNNSMSGG
ncbi:MAG: tandem-95 repeat protein, partial [Xanthomonadaceae bacterium]|nr:tandem-95 repeat protein [Xanthomonadaceae bacterium]